MSTYANRWIVGLDLRPTGQGAICFARFIGTDTTKGTSPASGSESLVRRFSPVIAAASVVDSGSSTASGASFTPSTTMLSVATSLPPFPSLTR